MRLRCSKHVVRMPITNTVNGISVWEHFENGNLKKQDGVGRIQLKKIYESEQLLEHVTNVTRESYWRCKYVRCFLDIIPIFIKLCYE
jgi:hypothetical protein